MTMTYKPLIFVTAVLMTMTACEKTPSAEELYPQMEDFYTESCGLSSVPADSVRMFAGKVDGYTVRYPEAKQHTRYPQIRENIRAASLRLSITINTEWDGEIHIGY